jgi:DNA mismatch endonuclease (patch repair protein)
MPASRPHFWSEKFRRTVERDREAETRLLESGWKPLVIWECETRDEAELSGKLLKFLTPGL